MNSSNPSTQGAAPLTSTSFKALSVMPQHQEQQAPPPPPPPPPHRAFSDPAPLDSISKIRPLYGALESPKSAGHPPRNMSFGAGPLQLSKTGETANKNHPNWPVKRRHSHEAHTNVHTECGRHSDDWLFGGFSVAGAVKRLWEKKA